MRLKTSLSVLAAIQRDIDCISYCLVFFVLVFGIRTAYIAGTGGDLWPTLTPLATSLSALLVSRNAKHILVRGDIQREDDRRHELVKITHHLMATVSSLINHVSYFKSTIEQKTRPALVVAETAENIVLRYEVLLEREPYKYLPGPMVDLIGNMSGAILGIKAFATGVTTMTAKNPLAPLSSVMPPSAIGPVEETAKLITELETLDGQIRALRAELEDID